MTRSIRERLLATTIIAGIAVLSIPAAAQTPTAGQPGNPTTDNTEAGASSGPIEGQTPLSGNPDVQASGAGTGDIIVTGSRIPQPNLTSAAPVTVVTAQEIKLQGTTRVEDLLNSLPQVFAGQASSLSNGASGTASVDLRNLGPRRTLVLVNGRRLVPGDPVTIDGSAADLNFIPGALVKRVEVLTGGASSTYGADAVGGVVNFIMDTDFTGFRIDGQYSLYQHDNRTNLLRGANNARTAAGAPGFGFPDGNVADGGTIDTTAVIGAGFDDNRGHVTAYVGYRKVSAVTQDRRDYSSCTPQASATAGALICGGSATSREGNFFDSASSSYNIGANRTLNPGLTRFNFAPTNYFQRPDERYTAGLFAHYDINEAIKPYMEFMFMDDRTRAQIAPSGDFGNTLQVNCDNPLLSAEQAAVVCRPENLVTGFLGTFPTTAANGITPDRPNTAPYQSGYLQLLRRNVEGGPRIADLQHTAYRGLIGTKGAINDAFSYDASFQYGRTVYAQTYFGEFSTRKLRNALNVVTGPGGAPTCRSVLDGTDPNCVPYDFLTLGGVTPAALSYVSSTGFQRGQTTEQVVSASITADFGKYGITSPLARDGVQANVGFEYRRETLELNTDEAFTTGDLTGQGGPTVSVAGGFKVTEGYGEIQIPIVQDNFIYDLSFNGGYRYSHYVLDQGFGGYNTNTFKLAGEFAPIKDVRIRGGYNRAVRAPNVQELFAPRIVALDGSTDPCAGPIDTDDDGNALGTVNGNSAAQCAFTGVSAAQFGNIAANPAAQYNGLQGGTSTLRPEVAITKTVGVVLQPSFLRRFALTVDYFDIKIKKPIQGYGADTIIGNCVNTGSAATCGLINRNPAGSLWLTPDGFITDVQNNVGSIRTKGIDLNASYAMEIGRFGSLGANLVGTYLDKLVTDPGLPGVEAYDCRGYFGNQCGVPSPKFRGKARVTYTSPIGAGLSFQWRYLGPVSVDASSSNTTLAGAFSPTFGRHIGSFSYFDLTSTFKVGDHLNMRAGVNNLADKRPPLINSNGTLSNCPGVVCSGGTFPAIYDALGRYLFVGATLDF